MVKQSVHTRSYRIQMAVIGTVTLLFSLHSLAALFLLTRFETPVSIYAFVVFVIIVTLIAGAKILFSAFRHMILDDTGIVYTALFHPDRHIRWQEVREIGVGRVYTPYGIRRRIYLASETLSDAESKNLDLATGKCIYFARLSGESLQQIQEHLPISVPENIYAWVR